MKYDIGEKLFLIQGDKVRTCIVDSINISKEGVLYAVSAEDDTVSVSEKFLKKDLNNFEIKDNEFLFCLPVPESTVGSYDQMNVWIVNSINAIKVYGDGEARVDFVARYIGIINVNVLQDLNIEKPTSYELHNQYNWIKFSGEQIVDCVVDVNKAENIQVLLNHIKPIPDISEVKRTPMYGNAGWSGGVAVDYSNKLDDLVLRIDSDIKNKLPTVVFDRCWQDCVISSENVYTDYKSNCLISLNNAELPKKINYGALNEVEIEIGEICFDRSSNIDSRVIPNIKAYKILKVNNLKVEELELFAREELKSYKDNTVENLKNINSLSMVRDLIDIVENY